MTIKKRNIRIDILKGLAIISAIIGHSTNILPITSIKISKFVYLFHLSVFFYVSGLLFDFDKSKTEEYYIYRIVKKNLEKYFCYNLVFVLLHNYLLNMKLIEGNLYSFSDYILLIFTGMTFQTNETMLAALWFIPVYVFACIIFILIIKISGIIHIKSNIKQKYIELFLVTTVSIIGYYMNYNYLLLPYHIQTSFLEIIIIYFGYKTKDAFNKIDYKISILGIALGVILYYLSVRYDIQVELSKNIVCNNIFEFYLVSIIGIYFLISCSYFVEKTKASKIISIIGRNSYHYMALHFIVFKMIDYGFYNSGLYTQNYLNSFPTTYNFGLLYTIITILFIMVLLKILKNKKY